MPAKKGKVVQDAGANDPPKGVCILFAFCSATLRASVRQLCAHLFGNFVRICSATLRASVRQLCAHLFGNFARICSGRVVRFLTQLCFEQITTKMLSSLR
jgi:hypothetical protein